MTKSLNPKQKVAVGQWLHFYFIIRHFYQNGITSLATTSVTYNLSISESWTFPSKAGRMQNLKTVTKIIGRKEK